MENRIKEILAENAANGKSPRTQEELAQATRIPASYISKIVTDNVKTPGADMAISIARALGKSVEEVFSEEAH